MNSVELKSAISDYVKECRNIVDTCKKEIREMTEEEKTRFEELKEQIAAKKAELQKLEEELDKIEIPTEEVEKEDEEKNNEERKMENNFNLIKELREAMEPGKSATFTIPVENRDAYTVTADGEHVVETNFWDILTPLRHKNVLLQSGAKFYPNLDGNVQIPVMGATNVNWAGETEVAGDGAGTFSHVNLSPKRITAFVELSLQFLKQDSLGLEEAIKADIVEAISAKLNETLLGAGAGDANTPAGLFHGNVATLTDTYAKVCSLEATLEEAKVNDYKYILSPKAKAAFKAMPMSSKATRLVMEGNEIGGVPAVSTGYVADNQYLVGDFSNLVIGQWGGIDVEIVRDAASLKKGCVTLVLNTEVDAKVAREGMIKAGKVSE